MSRADDLKGILELLWMLQLGCILGFVFYIMGYYEITHELNFMGGLFRMLVGGFLLVAWVELYEVTERYDKELQSIDPNYRMVKKLYEEAPGLFRKMQNEGGLVDSRKEGSS